MIKDIKFHSSLPTLSSGANLFTQVPSGTNDLVLRRDVTRAQTLPLELKEQYALQGKGRLYASILNRNQHVNATTGQESLHDISASLAVTWNRSYATYEQLEATIAILVTALFSKESGSEVTNVSRMLKGEL